MLYRHYQAEDQAVTGAFGPVMLYDQNGGRCFWHMLHQETRFCAFLLGGHRRNQLFFIYSCAEDLERLVLGNANQIAAKRSLNWLLHQLRLSPFGVPPIQIPIAFRS